MNSRQVEYPRGVICPYCQNAVLLLSSVSYNGSSSCDRRSTYMVVVKIHLHIQVIPSPLPIAQVRTQLLYPLESRLTLLYDVVHVLVFNTCSSVLTCTFAPARW